MECPICKSTELEFKKENNTYTCIECGFFTQNGYNVLNKLIIFNTIPELFKDICIEEDEQLWFPVVMNWEDTGMLFPDGTSIDNWEWVVAPCVTIPKEERKSYPNLNKFGEYHKTKVSFKDAVRFGRNFKLAVAFLYNLKIKRK